MTRPERPAYRMIIAFLLGLASVMAFAPAGWFPLIFVSLGGLYALLGKSSSEPRCVGTGALIGGIFGLGLFLGGVSWVFVSLSTFGGLPSPFAAFATFLFCAFLALYPALVGALFVRFAPSTWWQRGLFFAALWTLGEWLRGWVLSGFPWLAIGYSQTPPSPLAGFVPVLGVYGLSLCTALLATLLCEFFCRCLSRSYSTEALPARRHCALPLLPVIAMLACGALLREHQWTHPVGKPLTVALLQGNIPQELKWRPEWFNESLRTYYRLAHDNPAQLTVLPETAIPAFLDQLPLGYIDELRTLALRQQGELLIGIATGNRVEYANSALSVGASGNQQYNKTHLVPFGEFVPPGFRWFMAMTKIPMSDFAPGSPHQPLLRVGELRVAANICYEDAFGEEIIRALPEAGLLVNLSNVAWFGDSLAPAQHLQIAQLRALETGRMMLRATNTGMTAVIAADGRIVAVLKPYTRGVLRSEVQAFEGATPYVRLGNAPVVIISLLLIAFFLFRKKVS